MPRYVDHDARRAHMAATAAELVGTHGLSALTFRNVARAAGSSTTVLTHYFADKDDLMLSTFELVAARSGGRFDAAREAGGELYECLEALLPLDRERQTEWRLLTCYWGLAVNTPELAAAHARHVRSAQRRIELLLRGEQPDLSRAELETAARRLGALVQGLGAHHALDPAHWPPAKQRRVLRGETESVRRRGSGS